MPTGIYVRTKEIRQNMSKGHIGKKRSLKDRQAMSNSRIGMKFTNEHRQNLSKAGTGKHFSEEHRQNIGKALIGILAGEKNPNWQGGISFEPYSVDWTETLKRSIRERDHYICQLCSNYGNTVHHIDYDKKNCNPTNLITLCVGCNTKVNFDREHWIKYFKGRLAIKNDINSLFCETRDEI